MNRFKILVLIALLTTTLFGKNVREAFVEETLQGGSYTYMKVKDTKSSYWIAVSRVDGVKKGDEIRFTEEMVVEKLNSKALKRDFKNIVFASNLMYRTALKENKNLALITQHSDSSVFKNKNTITVKDAILQREANKDKLISIRGQVAKVSKNILNKNWIHIQDGTGSNGVVERVVFTSTDEPKLGSIITATGFVRVEKNFGSGYVYKIIVENATFSK